MNVKEIAHETITALKLVPDKDVWIDHTQPHWDGKPRFYITSEPTVPESATQFGVVTATTDMAIHCLAQKREEADDLVRKAVSAVYAKFSEWEEDRDSGILCITYIEHNTFQMPDRADAFHAFFTFRILHKINGS